MLLELDIFNTYSGFEPIVSSKTFSISRLRYLFSLANQSAVLLSLFLNLTSAPNLNKTLTTANRPFLTTIINSVYPNLSCLFKTLPRCSRLNRTV